MVVKHLLHFYITRRTAVMMMIDNDNDDDLN